LNVGLEVEAVPTDYVPAIKEALQRSGIS
jgi:hypothetical protein